MSRIDSPNIWKLRDFFYGSNTNYYFEFGTTTSYGSQTLTQNAGSGTSSVNVSADISGLSCGITYHYRIKSANGFGLCSGNDVSLFLPCNNIIVPSSIPAFEWVVPGICSSVRNFILAGTCLACNIKVKASQYFEISDDGNNWTDSLTTPPPPADGNLNEILYVRYCRQQSLVSSGQLVFSVCNTNFITILNLLVSVVDELNKIPEHFQVAQNYPNPFNPTTEIRFGVPMRSLVSLEIFNTLGQRVKTLVEEVREAGYFDAKWDGNVVSGVYFYRLEAVDMSNPANRFVETRKMLLIR